MRSPNAKYSASKENYLKSIFHLQQEQETVSTNALAEALRTKPASVTDMLKKLQTQKLLQYEKYYGVRLSPEGRKIALQIIRKHRLWEYFLVEKLHFGWEEVHDIAEELEHISSKKLIDRLDGFLGFPQRDPHGDPIPDTHGKLPTFQQVAIIDLPLNRPGVVNGINDQSPEMLELLKHKKIYLGSRLEVRRKFPADGSLEIKIRNQQQVSISEHVAKNLMVTYEEQPVQ
jgi:DtxR family transcriptional regulator, Mn-dependent transcriptional regulator